LYALKLFYTKVKILEAVVFYLVSADFNLKQLQNIKFNKTSIRKESGNAIYGANSKAKQAAACLAFG
jgi:hypothetical protein